MQFNKFFKIFIFIAIIFIGILFFAISTDWRLNRQKEIDKVDISRLPKTINNVKNMILVSNGTFYFYMDETAVTYADFQKYVNAGGEKSKYWNYESYNQSENPVTGVDWYHAADFCNWRSKVEGFPPAYKLTEELDAWNYPVWELDNSSDSYRLPNKSEFEYAARGGLEEKSFPWGNEFDSSFANFDDERGLMKGDWWRLAKVKDTPPNGYGLYGMSGNVWQWTNDWYDSDRTKVLKGGSWGSISPDYLRIGSKSYSAPNNYNYDIGFRCIRSITEQIIEQKNYEVPHTFYQYKTPHYENPLKIDVYSKEFIDRLSQFIVDYYPNSIYFQVKIDGQEIITPKEITELIIKVSKEYYIHPLFLTGVMTAESGFGTVSFPRWYNNPMAYHWQNALMKNGLPTYEANPLLNRKYKDLKIGFQEFAKGIRKDIYLKAAQKDLDAFHLLYVGYRANEWMYTISKTYNDVLGIRLESHFPVKNVGELIYTDFAKLIAY